MYGLITEERRTTMARKEHHQEAQSMPLLMTAKQMSKVAGIGENTIRRLMEMNEIEYLQVGSHRLLRVDAIWDYYERHKIPACA